MTQQKLPADMDLSAPEVASQRHETQPPEDVKPPGDPPEKKLGILRRSWQAIGLDLGTVLIMAKGGMPPAISLAAYQSSTWAAKYTTLGYLVAITSTLGMCIMPRAKFTQTMLFNIVSHLVSETIADGS